jgi:methylthioribose-1-phosphate isomerase
MKTITGDGIKIEQRDPKEVTEMWYSKRMAPEGIGVFNPAFDVTDNEMITAFVTEKGIVKPPFKENFAKLFNK